MLKTRMTKTLFVLIWPLSIWGLPSGPQQSCTPIAQYLLENGRQVPISQLTLADLKHAIREYLSTGKVKYSEHALRRMQERMVSEREVEYTLRRFDKIQKDPNPQHPNNYILMAKVIGSGRKLKVIVGFETYNRGLKIVTAEYIGIRDVGQFQFRRYRSE